MRRDPLVSVFVALASVTVCTVVVWLLFFRPTNEVVHERTRTGPTLVLVQPPSTPLRDSIREPKAAKKSQGPGRRSLPTIHPDQGSTQESPTRTGPKASTGLPKPRKRRTARTPQKPSQAPTGTSTQPSGPSQPPPLITVPLPSICTQPVHVGTCP